MILCDAPPAEKALIPSLKFSTESAPRQEQFAAWRDFTASMCDLDAITPLSQGFRAGVQSYQLGSLQLASFQLSPVIFRYTRDTMRKAGLDHWCIGVATSGSFGYESDDVGFKVSPGELVLQSYASPFSGIMQHASCIGLFFSRDDFWDVAEQLDQAAHRLVKGPMSQVVRDFLISLSARADRLTGAEASAASDAFSHLIRAMITNTPTSLEAARVPITTVQFDRARRYINANLKSPSLTPDTICANIGVSRRHLYYLFEQHGGVAKYIRNRRLSACYSALTKISDWKMVSSIAYGYGFTNLSSFYRQFQLRYGFSPRDARSAAQSGDLQQGGDGTTFADWLLRNS